MTRVVSALFVAALLLGACSTDDGGNAAESSTATTLAPTGEVLVDGASSTGDPSWLFVLEAGSGVTEVNPDGTVDIRFDDLSPTVNKPPGFTGGRRPALDEGAGRLTPSWDGTRLRFGSARGSATRPCEAAGAMPAELPAMSVFVDSAGSGGAQRRHVLFRDDYGASASSAGLFVVVQGQAEPAEGFNHLQASGGRATADLDARDGEVSITLTPGSQVAGSILFVVPVDVNADGAVTGIVTGIDSTSSLFAGLTAPPKMQKIEEDGNFTLSP